MGIRALSMWRVAARAQRHFATAPPAAAKQATKPAGGSGIGRGLLVGSVVVAASAGARVVQDEESRAKFDLLRSDLSSTSAWAFARALMGQQDATSAVAAEPIRRIPKPAPIEVVQPEPEPEPVAAEQAAEPAAAASVPEPELDQLAIMSEAPEELPVMSEADRIDEATEIVRGIPGVQVCQLPSEAELLASMSHVLSAPPALPDNFDELDAQAQKEACQLALSTVTEQYNSLVTALEQRTKWEAVRLAATLSHFRLEHTVEMRAAVDEAMSSQGRKFDAALNHRTQRMHQQHLLDTSAQLTEQKKALQKLTDDHLAKNNAAAELKLAEEQQLLRATIMHEIGLAAVARTSQLQKMQMKMEALQQVLVDDDAYKMRSHHAHKVSQSVLAINKCLQQNTPFKDELEILHHVGLEEPLIAAVAASVPASAAANGACTRAQLQESLKEISPEACRAALMPEDGGLLWYAFTWAINKAKIKETGQVEGNSAVAVLTRAEDKLERGDLKAALDEVTSLDGMPAQVLSDWKSLALERLQIEQALELARAHTLCMTTTFE